MFIGQKKKILLYVNQSYGFYAMSLAFTYLLLGRLSIYSNAIGTIVAPALFIPAGLSLWMAFFLNNRFWISIFFGEYLISATLGLPWGVSLGLGLANTLSFLLTTQLIKRWKINPTYLSIKNFWLQNCLIFLTQIVSAAVANFVLYLNDPSQNFDTTASQTASWFLSNVLTQVLIFPILLSLSLKQFPISKRDLPALIALFCISYLLSTRDQGNYVMIGILACGFMTWVATKSTNLLSITLIALTYIAWNLFSHHQGIFSNTELTALTLTTLIMLSTLPLQLISHLSDSLKSELLLKKDLVSRLKKSESAFYTKHLKNLIEILKNTEQILNSKKETQSNNTQNFILQMRYASLIAKQAKVSSALDSFFSLYFLIRTLCFRENNEYLTLRKETLFNQNKIFSFIENCLLHETGELSEIRARYIKRTSKASCFDNEHYPELVIIDIVEEFHVLTELHGLSISKAIKSIKGNASNVHHQQFIIAFEQCLGEILIAKGLSSEGLDESISQDLLIKDFGREIESNDQLQAYDTESDQVYKTLFNSSSLGLALVDFQTGHFLEVNNKLLEMTGYEKSEFLSKTFWDITPRSYADQEERQLSALLKTGKFGLNEKEYIRKDGSVFPISIEGFIATYKNKQCVWGVIQDLTNSKNIAELSEEKIGKDFLTGLSNRYLWQQRFNQAMALASRNKSSVALMLIDLDRFKPINDNYGHQIGDEVLIEFSKRLNKIIKRKSDTSARLGGDEFAILLPETNKSYIVDIAEKILKTTTAPFQIGNIEINLSCSIGISSSEHSSYEEKILFEMADSALLKAKKNGRNQYVISKG